MEAVKKRRTVLRSAFTKIANKLEAILNSEELDFTEIEAQSEMLQEKNDAIKLCDEEVFTAMLAEDASEEDLTAELTVCDEYGTKFARVKSRYRKLIVVNSEVVSQFNTHVSEDGKSNAGARKFKLPQIQFTKFGGELRDWLPFWSQFKKIDEAEDLVPEDKFQYLLLAISPNTRARDLVESFPPTADNYAKVIESLKSRFGREDLLIEFYVRELLKLVLSNATSNQTKCGIATLYDKMETQLRALETLGITTDTCAAMLYPLVESCLPEELLRVWQRSTEFSNKLDSTIKNRLSRLMNFLKAEVEGEERIALAVEGFGWDTSTSSKQKRIKPKVVEQGVATAAGLINNAGSLQCVFCSGNHVPEKCFKAQKLTLEEKKNVLSKKKGCFRCAKIGHHGRRCRERLSCVVCGGLHIVLLCPDLIKTSGNRDKTEPKELTPGKKDIRGETSLANSNDTRVFLQTLVVKLYNESEEREVRAIIDTGSQRSYILQSAVRELRYQPKRDEPVVHALFGGSQTAVQRHKCYDVKLASLDDSFACKFEVLDQPVICHNIPSIFPGIWTKELQEVNVELTDTRGRNPITLLIGADIAGKIFTGKKQVLPCGLIAMETLLGWVMMGKIPVDERPRSTTMIVANLLNKDNSIAALWQLDVLGITDPGENKSKIELEIAAKKLFEETVSVNTEGRYEVALPWLEGHPPLPSNLALARKRLQATENKLKATRYWDDYNKVFSEWLADDVIEEVPTRELDKPAHYLPHRPVIKESSTTRIRPVFDASAREKGKPSLNDCLEKGANLIEQIPTILLRFRFDRIGVTADIRKAFLQIGLKKSDRDHLRFIWKTEDDKEKIFRHKRVVFGVNSSPFLLGATIEHHLKGCLSKNKEDRDYSDQTIVKLMNSFYVDNCVSSVPNVQALEVFVNEATEVMAQAMFDLRGWEFTRDSGPVREISLLGMKWNKDTDTLSVNCVQEDQEDKITKRSILSLAQRIFDPIGYVSPALLCPKLLLQKMWEEKISWDDEVKEESQRIFERWKSELPYLSAIKIPRWINITQEKVQNLMLHTFCDASKTAYAAVVFLRVESNDTVEVHLLQAKTRVAPIKRMSIPRLELMAATIGARLGSRVQQVFGKAVKHYFWTDSTTVLGWIKRTEEWATFVWNRVEEIKALTDVDSWNHVPGEQNPADLPSRGCSPKQLAESSWWEGPKWLREDPKEWPRKECVFDENELNKERKRKVVTIMLNSNDTQCFYQYFSKYRNNVRMIAWMLRFVHNSKCKKRQQPLRKGELDAEEIKRAERKLIWLVQQESFSDKDGRLATLKVLRDEEGILRLETKISRRLDLNTFLYPYILPDVHPVVNKLIHEVHVNQSHVGIQGLLSILREQYWILGGRRTVRSVISKCVTCKRYTAKRFEEITPSLPFDRTKEAACFETTGVDLAGPLYLRDGKKAWICLYTCAVYRAVHLDVVTSLSTNGFMKSLRRFIARRGRPKTIYSDNGTNFIGTENLLRNLDWNEIKKQWAVHQISWRFSPPSAPWWGGWWERLIGLVKQLLRRVLGHAQLDAEELYTVLCDCEIVINSRPLTYVSNEPDELIPLTPLMFLHGLSESAVPDCDLVDHLAINKRFRYLQKLREDLRRRFRSEYLGQLRQTVRKKVRKSRSVTIGEVVLIGNDQSKRLDWPLGKVIELLPGKDGNVRLVRVQTQYGQLLRPIQRLYPLECMESWPTARTTQTPDACPRAASPEDENPEVVDLQPAGNNDVKCSEKVSRYGRKIKLPKRYDSE